MVDWDPEEHMGLLDYLQFKLGRWVEVDSVPDWVRSASNPPKKTEIPINGYVSATFNGDSLQYKVVTNRVPRGAGTGLKSEFYVRINPSD